MIKLAASVIVIIGCSFIANVEGRAALPEPYFKNLRASNITGCGALAVNIEECFLSGSGLPDKCNGKSTTVTCAEKAYKKYYKTCPYELITRFADNFMNGLKSSDKLLCTKQLYKDFLDNIWCWGIVKPLGYSYIVITKGYFTKDGCGAVELNMDIFKAGYPGICANLMEKYLRPLYNASPCGNSI